MNRIGDNLVHTGPNEAIVKAFVTFEVEFVLVGGLAISWYCQSRQADDMDLLVKPTKENSQKVTNALASLNLNGFVHNSFSKYGVQAPIKKYYYADIITPASEEYTFEEIINNSVNGKLFEIPIFIPSIDNLIRLKENAISSTQKELTKHNEDIILLKNIIKQ